MLNAPTAQTITRAITDPEVSCRVGSTCGAAAGLGFGIFQGMKVTGCSGAQCMYCIQFGNVTDCNNCLAATTLCSLTSLGITIAGGLTLGVTGYMCAKQMQRSSCLANGSMEANMPPDQGDPTPAREITCTTDQKITAPVTNSEVIDRKPLPYDAHLTASTDSMATPSNPPPTYEKLYHAPPPTYEEAIKLLRDGARE